MDPALHLVIVGIWVQLTTLWLPLIPPALIGCLTCCLHAAGARKLAEQPAPSKFTGQQQSTQQTSDRCTQRIASDLQTFCVASLHHHQACQALSMLSLGEGKHCHVHAGGYAASEFVKNGLKPGELAIITSEPVSA